MLTTWPWLPVKTMKPFWFALCAAEAFRVDVTLQDWVAPGAVVNAAGSAASRPSRPTTDGVYASDFEPTLVALRETVCDPAMSPIAIDAELRFDPSIAGSGPVYRPW